ncbi:type II toxin-antitoxin system RelE/ParE family toxin [Candidatus Curtissbacteria bacterium]|nr:type II toxin-antitoxin system RelE/ParE family toxin [Candidatus Curtissbacteria bacterium]
MSRVLYLSEVAKYIENLNPEDHARLTRTRQLFEERGFIVGQKYVKKIARGSLWELRAGKIRLFLCIRGNTAVGVHILQKKSQKLPLKDVKLAERRCKQL